MCCCMIKTSSVYPGKSLVVFGKSSEKLVFNSEQFWKSLEIFRKWSEIIRKLSKTSSLVCLYNKQNITCLLVDMNFIFSWSTQNRTSQHNEGVRYRVEHSEIKFISTCGHVISSISLYYPRAISLNYPINPCGSST